MGVVYRAADTLLHDRVVAVKVMTAHLSAESAYRAAFLREGEVAAEVSHPHVVPVHAAGEEGGLLYLAMAWIDGPDLRRLATAGGLSAARIVSLVSQVARALDALHDAGIVHGDVKPSNVLVHREDHAYLVDFGVARRSAFADPTTGDLLGGTPAFAAPETARGLPDPASDQYSLGCDLRAADGPAALRHRRSAGARVAPRELAAPAGVGRDARAGVLRRRRGACDGARPGRALPVGRRLRAGTGGRRACCAGTSHAHHAAVAHRDPNPTTRRRARGPRARIPATGRALGPPGRVSAPRRFALVARSRRLAVPRRVLAQRHRSPTAARRALVPRRRSLAADAAPRRAPARASRGRGRRARGRGGRRHRRGLDRDARRRSHRASAGGRRARASHGCSRTTPTRSTAATSTCWPGRSQRASCVRVPMASRATA